MMSVSPRCCRTKKTFPLSQVAVRVCLCRVTCRFSLISVSLAALCLFFTHRERNQLNLRYTTCFLSSLKKKKSTYEEKKKEPELNCLTVQFFFACVGKFVITLRLTTWNGKNVSTPGLFLAFNNALAQTLPRARLTSKHVHTLAHTHTQYPF